MSLPPNAGTNDVRAGSETGTLASFREIVACLDGSELGSGIVPHAQLFASAFGARLTLLHVLESQPTASGSPPDPVGWEIRQREARAQLESLAGPLVELQDEIRSELIQGRPAEQICAWAEQHSIDLTVICSHGQQGVTDWGLASTARKVVERTPGSLLLVPAAAAVKGRQARYRRILVPLDGSPRAESVLPIAIRLATSQKAELLIVHIVPVPEVTHNGPVDEEGADLARQLATHNRRVASAYLDRVRARINQPELQARTIVIGDGAAPTAIERVIGEDDVDLVVMAAHGQQGRSDVPFGRLTEHVLTHAKTPLLVVRERGFRRARAVRPHSTRPSERIVPSGRSTS